ncbi:MAG: cysteine desulfurase family protein [Chitinophagaceae bacterium]
MDIIYLDNAATTSLDETVLEAMIPYMTTKFGNPSSIYSYGRDSRLAIENSRKKVASILNASPKEIFFNSGGTESNNAAIFSAIRDLQCTHIITSPIEHHAVLNTVEHYKQTGLVTTSFVKLLPDGHVDLADLEAQLKVTRHKCLVTLMHANNEIGNLLDIQAVGNICKVYSAIFHSDCVQTVGHYPINLQDIYVHFITASGHKFHGPKGTGILYINKDISIKPFIFGGGQERNMRAGTENLYGIVGFAKALELSMENLGKDAVYISSLKFYMKSLLEHIPGVSFNGDVSGNSLYTVLNATFPASKKTEMLLFNLDQLGICVSGGSACGGGGAGGSHVINALQNSNKGSTIRFSFSKFSSKEQVDEVVSKLKELM